MPDAVDRFLEEHRLPGAFRTVVAEHYRPLADWVRSVKQPDTTEVIGISGAQGTGKSTLADYLCLALEITAGWSVANLSIDDFYLTQAERQRLAAEIHPLLATRGAPGTHDVALLTECIENLKGLGAGQKLAVPCFDKALDDRGATETWPAVEGPVDLIILEGWCVGGPPQAPTELEQPVNALEETEDPDARWRTYVNQRLGDDYARLFSLLDRLVFLRAPDMEAVLRWRIEQEKKLAAARGPAARGVMSESEIAVFIQYYERITKNNIEKLPAAADVVLELDSAHGVVESRYRRDQRHT